MFDNDLEAVIHLVKIRAQGRTRYEGQPPYEDETLVAALEAKDAEIERLNLELEGQRRTAVDAVKLHATRRAEIARLRDALVQIERFGWLEGTKYAEWLLECRGIATAAL